MVPLLYFIPGHLERRVYRSNEEAFSLDQGIYDIVYRHFRISNYSVRCAIIYFYLAIREKDSTVKNYVTEEPSQFIIHFGL